ncbi:MAG: hypothetical protein AAGK97_17735 [Bacteroidota bacterium]
MSPKLKKLFLTLTFSCIGLAVYAQGKPDGPPPPDTRMPPTFPGLVVPIDENLMILLSLGFILGVYVVYKSTGHTAKSA